MSLKIVHFIVFIITALMFGIFAIMCWNKHNAIPEATEALPMCIGFALGSVGLFAYSFWYLKKARAIIT